jgi:hypothetical protein
MARRALAWWWMLLLAAAVRLAGADDPYRYFDWTVTYGPINPLGTTQQVLEMWPISLNFATLSLCHFWVLHPKCQMLLMIGDSACQIGAPSASLITKFVHFLLNLLLHPKLLELVW